MWVAVFFMACIPLVFFLRRRDTPPPAAGAAVDADEDLEMVAAH
jgi:hypothetical protein